MNKTQNHRLHFREFDKFEFSNIVHFRAREHGASIWYMNLIYGSPGGHMGFLKAVDHVPNPE